MLRHGVRSAGFTLIELLVVVAIIGLLVSILLPSLSKARAAARASVCATNLKGQGTAAQLYLASFKDRLPRRTGAVAGGGGAGGVANAFFSQKVILANDRRPPNILACPSDAWTGREYNNTDTPLNEDGITKAADELGMRGIYTDAKIRVSYGLNTHLVGTPATGAAEVFQRQQFENNVTKYKFPSQTYFYADSQWIQVRG